MKITLVIVAACTLAGCASSPATIDAAYVSPVKYQDYDCEQLAAEIAAVDQRVWKLRDSLQSKRKMDESQMAVGLILFWPALFFLEGGDGPEAVEYAQLQGEYQALRENARRCDTPPSGPALCDVYSAQEDKQACLDNKEWQGTAPAML